MICLSLLLSIRNPPSIKTKLISSEFSSVISSRNLSELYDLNSTSAELVFGSNPTVPGDMVGEPGPPATSKQLQSLLESLRQQAAQPATQTSNHGSPSVHTPHNLHNVTHVRIKRHKTHPLQHSYEGPFEIVERLGK